MGPSYLRSGIQDRLANRTNLTPVAADRSTRPALPLAGSKARSDTSPHRAAVPWIATPASLRLSSTSVGAKRALYEFDLLGQIGRFNALHYHVGGGSPLY